MPFTGSIQRLINKLTRTVTGAGQIFTGALARTTQHLRLYSRVLSLTGLANRSLLLIRLVEGAGSLLSGVVVGAIGQVNTYLSTGVQSFTGALTRLISVTNSLAGSLSLSGVLTSYKAGDVLYYTYTASGTMGLSGSLTRHIMLNRSVAGQGSFFSGNVPEAYRDMLYYGIANP